LARPSLANFACATLAVLLLLVVVWEVVGPMQTTFWGRDYGLYMRNVQRFLSTGTPYAQEQLAGPYPIFGEIMLYPPNALLLFVPFSFLPAPLWWLVPTVTILYLIARWHPTAWTWPLVALALAWPRSVGAIVAGNTDLWVASAVAAGLELGGPVAFILLKPSVTPLILAGWGHRKAAATAIAALALISLAFLPLWFQYLTALRNLGPGADYSLPDAPLLLSPVIAWLGRSRASEPHSN
jgi:hypothetical protein